MKILCEDLKNVTVCRRVRSENNGKFNVYMNKATSPQLPIKIIVNLKLYRAVRRSGSLVHTHLRFRALARKNRKGIKSLLLYRKLRKLLYSKKKGRITPTLFQAWCQYNAVIFSLCHQREQFPLRHSPLLHCKHQQVL